MALARIARAELVALLPTHDCGNQSEGRLETVAALSRPYRRGRTSDPDAGAPAKPLACLHGTGEIDFQALAMDPTVGRETRSSD